MVPLPPQSTPCTGGREPRYTADGDVPAVLDCPSWGPTPEEDALTREVVGRIWQAFRELPACQQEVFALRYLEEWSTEEVAGALRLSVGSVKQHLFIPPLAPGEGRVRAKQSQGESWRFLHRHKLICKLL